ncbi:MAG: GntR family transcriptional regulator [Trueperaceae bacterium]
MNSKSGLGPAGQAQTKQEMAYNFLKQKIMSRQLLPGQRIVTSQIAQEIGTSGMPVREALFKLQSERLVEMTPHVGAVVSLTTPEDIVKVLEPLAVLEGYATRLALPVAPSIEKRLQAWDSKMKQALAAEQWDQFSHYNREFHFQIYGQCQNEALVESIRGLWTRLDSYLSTTSFYLIPQRARGSLSDHERIVQVLVDPESDPLELEMFARQHKLNTAKHFTGNI